MKLRLIAIALLLTMGVLLPLSGCGQTDLPPESNDSTTDTDSVETDAPSTDTTAPEPCDVCTYGEWQTIQAPTCKEEGVQIHSCTVCGATQTAPIAKTLCIFGEWVTVTEPTETAVGQKKRVCAACGQEETAEIPKLVPLFSVSCKNGNKTTVVTAAEDGSYTIPAPTPRLGYDFLGWKTEGGEDFAAAGTILVNVTVEAQWAVAKTTTFAQLKERLEGGVDEILLDADIVLSDTIYVTGKSVLYITEDRNLVRSPMFTGDLFILGESADGENSVTVTGDVASLTVRADGESILVINGNKAEMIEDAQGTVFMLLNSSVLNLHERVAVINCKKVGNTRLTEADENVSKPERAGGAAAIIVDGVMNVYGAAFTDCEVNTDDKKTVMVEDVPTETDNDSSCGGAIFNRSTLNIYNGRFINNKAARGGAVFNYRVCKIERGMFVNNHAEVYGGALYLVDSQYATATIGTVSDQITLNFSRNTSQKSGGAIFGNHQSVVNIVGGVIFESNKSLTANGGAINMAGALTVSDSEFIGNMAASKGGAVYTYYSNPELTVREVNITDTKFLQNEAAKGGALGIGASKSTYSTGSHVTIGGATVFTGNVAFLTEEEDPTFIDNTDRPDVTKAENGEGGAIYVFWKGQLTVGGETVFGANRAGNKGGAIYVTTSGSRVTVTGTEEKQPQFHSNEATGNGGAIYAYTGTTVSATYASFTDNKSSGDKYGGGAFYFSGSTGNFSHVSFQGNQSLTKNGGAICAYSNSTLNMSDVVFTENTAVDNGGAICLNKSELIAASELILRGNEAGGDGGAIHVKDSSVTANTITAASNTAEGGGGAIYLNKADTSIAELYVTTLTVSDNTATVNGGALYIHTNALAEIGALTATGNTSAEYGGAIYASSKEDVVITTANAVGNEASKGGFLYLTTGGTTVTIYSGTASDNVAADGGETVYSNTAAAILKLGDDFTYPENTMTGKNGVITVEPAEVQA